MAIRIPIISSFDNKGVTKAIRDFKKLEKGSDKIAFGLLNADAAAKKLAASALRIGGAVSIFGGIAARSFIEFDDAMNQSLAIMGNVSDDLRQEMSEAARQMAKETTFSATQAAQSYYYLASAGLDAQQSIQALPKVAQFAQAGMFDMARATDLLTDAQSALGMTIKDDATANMLNMARVSDVLVKANTLANASVEQFSVALTNKAAASARVVGKDVEETVAVLAAFADQGVKAEEAGTQFSIVMRELQTRAIKNAKAFRSANIQVFDQSGEMQNLAKIIQQLEKRFAGMSDQQKKSELAALGFADKSQGALLTLLGTGKAIEDYEKKLREAGGTTESVANKQLESFKGQLILAKNALMDLLISLGERLAPMIGKMSAVIRKFAEIVGERGLGAAFNYLAGSMIRGIWNMGKLGKAIFVVVGAFTALRIAAVTFSATQAVIKVATELTTGALNAQIVALNSTKVALMAAGGVTALLTIAASLYAVYATVKGTAIGKTREFSDALYDEGDAQKQAIADLIKSQKAFRYLAKMLDMSGTGVGAFEEYLNNGTGALAQFKERIDAAVSSNREMIYWNTKGEAFAIPVKQAKIYQKALNDLIDKQKDQVEVQKILKGLGIDLTDTNTDVADTVKTAAERFKDYVSALRGAKSEQKGYASAIKSTKEATTALSDATANVAKAQEYYDNVVRGFGAGSDEAITAQEELSQAQRDATRAGFDSTRAQKAVTDAEKALEQARRRRNPQDIADAEMALTEAQLNAEEKTIALKEANDAVEEAQRRLNETLNGASTASETYKTALDALNDAKAKEVEAADNVAEAIDREADAKFRLAEAEKELRTARSGVSTAQAKQAQKQTGIDGKTVTDKRKEFLAKVNKQLGTKFKSIMDYVNAGSGTTGKADRKEAFNRFARQNNIPQLANGGIAMQPTFALIGEKAPEAVIPLSRLETGNSGGDTYITVTVTSADPNAVVDALRRYQRQNGGIPIRVVS